MPPPPISPPGAHLDGPVAVVHRDAQAAGQAAQVACDPAADGIVRRVIIQQQEVAAGLGEAAAAAPCRSLQPGHKGGACGARHRGGNKGSGLCD